MRAGIPSPSGRIDGILCMLGGWGSRPDLAGFVRRARVPAVDLHEDASRLRVARVALDNRAIGRLAAAHFLERRYRHFAFFGPVRDDRSFRDRHAGYAEAAGRRGRPVTLFDFSAALGSEKARSMRRCAEWLGRQLRAHPRPLALFAADDDFAVAALDACLLAGLLVPEDVAVLGCANDPLVCEFAPVPISSVDPDLEARSYRAAALLDRLMKGGRRPAGPIRIRPRGVVVRRSTDIVAVPDRRVAMAVDFIRQRFRDRRMGVGDVARAAATSVGMLTALFHRHLGRTPGVELRLARLRHAQGLIQGGTRKATAAALASGFSSLLHFRRALQRHTGLSPRRWRKRYAGRMESVGRGGVSQ
jgi:LacI family transcriptional regulator